MGRIPSFCPLGFTQYTVVRGDSIYLIARRLEVNTGFIIANNPHISNPLLIYQGDILCVPIPITLPCSTLLKSPSINVSNNALGAALAQQLTTGEQAVSIIATGLPNPSQFGQFNAYEGHILFPGIGSYGFVLYLTPDQPPTWSRTFKIPVPLLYQGTEIQVRATHTETSVSPQVVLIGKLCK